MTRAISVIISSNGRAESLAETLEGLRHLDHPEFEVLVTVGPDDAGYAAVRSAAPPETRWCACGHRNASMARNVAVDAANGELMAFIDDDAVPEAAWLTELEAAFDDPEVAATGGVVVDHTGVSLQALYSVIARSGVPRVMRDGRDPSGAVCFPESWLVPNPIGTNMCVRSDALRAAGGFDEVFPYFLDESDLSVRLCDRGHRIALLGNAHVVHRSLASGVRDSERVVTDWSVILNSLFLFAHRHGLASGCHERTWVELNEHLGHIRNTVADQVSRGIRPPRAVEELERAIRGAERRAAEYADTAVPRGSDRRLPTGGVMRPYPSWGRVAAQRGYSRAHVALVAADGEDREGVASRLARDLVDGRGDIARVLVTGAASHTVEPERGVWHHRLPAAVACDAADPSVVATELSRIDGRRPLDAWAVVGAEIDGLTRLLSPSLAGRRVAVSEMVVSTVTGLS